MKKLNLIVISIILLTISGCTQTVVPPIELPIVDTDAPIIQLVGDEEVYHILNRTYIDLGASITDNVDSSDSLELLVSGDTVDTTTLGEYSIIYNTVDLSGNVATQVTRTVHVVYKEPGMTVSFSYESYDRIGMFIQVYDLNDILLDLEAFLYLDGVLVKSVTIENTMDSFEFTDLEVEEDYELSVEGTYKLGADQGTQKFTSTPIYVGTYRKLDENLIDDYPSENLFHAIQDLIYLPYNNSEDVILERIAFELTKIDQELVFAVASMTPDKIILTDGAITSVYDYFFLKGVDARGTSTTYDNMSGVCCNPMVVRYGDGRIPEQIILHEFGHSVDLMLLQGLSNSTDWINIWNAEKYQMFGNDLYFTDYPEEYFAESFAYYYQGETTRKELLYKAPATYAYMASLIDKLYEIYPYFTSN